MYFIFNFLNRNIIDKQGGHLVLTRVTFCDRDQGFDRLKSGLDRLILTAGRT